MRKISELGLLSILVCAFVRSSFPDFSEATQLCHRCPQIFVKDKNLGLEPPLPKNMWHRQHCSLCLASARTQFNDLRAT